jgi:hypothetical protein
MDWFFIALVSLCVELGPVILYVAAVPFVLVVTALLVMIPLFYMKNMGDQ